jgi:hypothetical protein
VPRPIVLQSPPSELLRPEVKVLHLSAETLVEAEMRRQLTGLGHSTRVVGV